MASPWQARGQAGAGQQPAGVRAPLRALLSVSAAARGTRQLSPTATATASPGGSRPSPGGLAPVQLVKYSVWTCRKKVSRTALGQGQESSWASSWVQLESSL